MESPSVVSLRRVQCRDGVQLAVHDFGGSGPPLIVLAASGFLPKVYIEVISELRKAFTCFGVDLRGHGDSSSGAGTDVLYVGEDIATVVHSLGLRGAYAFGHCLGAMAAIWAEILQPGCFCQIITYEPILYHFVNSHAQGDDNIRWTAPTLLARATNRRQRYFKSREEIRQKYAGKPPWNRFTKGSLNAYIEHAFKDTAGIACNMQLDDADGVELKSTPAAEADNMLWPRHIDPMHWVYPNLHKVKCPVSVMAGSDTSAENPGEFIAHYIQEVTDQFPNACFERLEGLQHLGPFEDPARVAERILSHADMSRAGACSRAQSILPTASRSSASAPQSRL